MDKYCQYMIIFAMMDAIEFQHTRKHAAAITVSEISVSRLRYPLTQVPWSCHR